MPRSQAVRLALRASEAPESLLVRRRRLMGLRLALRLVDYFLFILCCYFQTKSLFLAAYRHHQLLQ